MTVDLMRRFARNNAWANARLHAACARLTPEAYRARRVSFFPTIRGTLNHILIVDRYYIDALEEGGVGPSLCADDEPYADFGPLRAAQAESDRRLTDFCNRLDPLGLDRRVTTDRGGGHRPEETAGAILAHVFQHQIHHRGQVHAMLAGTDVAPPQLDEFFLAQDAPLRVGEPHAIERTGR